MSNPERAPRVTPPEAFKDTSLEKLSEAELGKMVGQLKFWLQVKSRRYFADGNWYFGDVLNVAYRELTELSIDHREEIIIALHRACERIRSISDGFLDQSLDVNVLRIALGQLPGDPESTEAEGE